LTGARFPVIAPDISAVLRRGIPSGVRRRAAENRRLLLVVADRRDHGIVTRRVGRGWSALVVLVCIAGAALPACSDSAVPAQSSPWWASVRMPGAVQTDAFRRVPGSASYRCVGVGHNRDVRSGGFLAGPFGVDEQLFGGAYQQYGQRNKVKIYWIPLDVGHMSTLTVHATLLTDTSVTRTVELTQVAAEGRDVFYPSAVPIPVPGTWELTASAGPNRGCFIVTFRASAL
jgi:hypothetical protein